MVLDLSQGRVSKRKGLSTRSRTSNDNLPELLGPIGTRPFDIKSGRGKAINLVSWSDDSRQVIHPVSKLDAK